MRFTGYLYGDTVTQGCEHHVFRKAPLFTGHLALSYEISTRTAPRAQASFAIWLPTLTRHSAGSTCSGQPCRGPGQAHGHVSVGNSKWSSSVNEVAHALEPKGHEYDRALRYLRALRVMMRSSLTDNYHASASESGRIDTEQKVPSLLLGITGARYDAVPSCTAGGLSFLVTAVP